MLNQNPLRAALWMSCAVLAFSFMAVAAREMLRHMEAFEILFLRTLVTMVLVLAVVARSGTATLRTRLFRFHLARALMHLGGQYCWIYAIGALTLATVFAIEFTMPVWVALLATAFLGERMNRGRVVMLVLGLAGIAIIVRPAVVDQAAGGLQPALVMVLGSMFYAGNMVMTKRISIADSPVDLAADLRREVRDMLIAGKSDDDVRNFMVARYGDFILFRPRFSARNAWLWLAPGVLLLIGAFVSVRIVRQRSALVDQDNEPLEEDVRS